MTGGMQRTSGTAVGGQAEKNVKIVSLEYESQGDEQGSWCGKLTDGAD